MSPVPEQVQRARALFYLYGEAEQRFSPLWEPAPCAAPCEEEVQLSLPDNNGALLEYTQIIGGARTTQSHVIPFAAPPPAAQ